MVIVLVKESSASHFARSARVLEYLRKGVALVHDLQGIEIGQAGLRKYQANSTQKVGRAGQILLESEVDQPDSRPFLIHRGRSLTAA